MELMRRNRRVWSVLATLFMAFFMLVAMLIGFGGMRQVAAFHQDDGRGWWTDTFTDAVGLDATVNVAVNGTWDRLELEPPTVLSQTDWSGGQGLLTTTATSTNRYEAGMRVDPLLLGDLSLGFSLPVSDDMDGFEQDGYPDLVLSNYYSGTEGSGGDYADESYLYYGSASSFSDANRAELPVSSAQGNAVADLNDDGFLDIVVARGNSSDRTGPAYIYWGDSDGYSTSDRTELASFLSSCGTIADLNNDGYLDIVICNFMDGSYDVTIDSYIYWGDSGGVYTTTNRTDLETLGAMSVYAADFDHDGYLDLLFSNYRNSVFSSDTATFAIDSYLYWGSATGFTNTNRTGIPTVGAHGSSVADLNLDGYLDLVISNRRTGDSTPVTLTYEIDSYVYWGDGTRTGYTDTNRLDLPTVGSYGNALADLNDDGYLEIIFSNHHDGVTYTLDSYIYWNDAGTFTTTNRAGLPTIGATGNCAGDLNLDGDLDIVFSNRRSGNDHNVPSYIYWGDSGTYSTSNRTSLNTHGALGCSIVGGTIAAANTAYGNVYAEPITGTTTITDTATTPRIYATTGVITSTGFDSGGARVWRQMTWNASVPSGTDIALDVATSDDGTAWSAWSQVAASSSDGFNSASLDVADARFIRYRATLTVSADHQQTPVLHDVQITGGRTDGNATSVTITPASLDRWDTITWTAQVAAGQAITVQVLDSSNALIPDGDLPGNSSGFSSSPVDISGLSVSSYPALRLRAWFSSDSVTTTPSLDDWAVDWFVTPTSLTISPENDTITAGDVVTYSVFAHDDYGGSWEVTADSQYTITLAAGGHWMDNVYTSEFADTWAVTGTYGSLSVATGLTVQHATAVAVEVLSDSETVTAGEAVTYTVVATDTYGNSWDATGEAGFDIEAGAAGSWTDNVYASEVAGTWTVTGTVDGVDGLATLTVNPAGLDHIVIEDGAGGAGSAVDTHTMNAGETFDVWAAGYDQYNNYLGDYSVTWSGTGVVAGQLAPTSGVSTTFTAVTAGTGTIQADHATATDDDTGTITVNPAGLDHIVIEDGAGGTGSAVDTHTLSAGETFDVWAAGYDVGNNYLGDYPVTWSGTGVVAGRLSPTSGVSTTFTAQTTGSGTIHADHAIATDDDTGTITVNPGGLDHVVIEDAAGGAGSEVTTHSINAGETFDVWAAGYDVGNNYLGDYPVTWSGTGVVAGRLSPTGGVSTTFTAGTAGTGTIQADAGGSITDATGTITVNPGSLHHFVFAAISSQTADQPFSVTITAQDEYGNTATGYTGIAVLTDTTGTISPTVTGNFVGGVWTGDVTITQAQSDVTITAEDGSVSGSSNSFDVTEYKIYLPLVVRGG